MVLLRKNIANAHNLIRVTSSLEFTSRMRISLDNRLIEVNIDIITESYATGCNCKDIATRIPNFVVNQAYFLSHE